MIARDSRKTWRRIVRRVRSWERWVEVFERSSMVKKVARLIVSESWGWPGGWPGGSACWVMVRARVRNSMPAKPSLKPLGRRLPQSLQAPALRITLERRIGITYMLF